MRKRGQGTRKGMPLLYDERASQADPCIVGEPLRPLRYRFFGEKAPRPRRGGGGDGLGGPLRMSSPPETEPHATSQPLPPLRGRRRFPCLFAKNLYLKGKPRPYYTLA
jgi:hypothetical protein